MNIHVKTLPITFDMVIEAYSKAKGGGKAVGIDRESWRSSSRKALKNPCMLSGTEWHLEAISPNPFERQRYARKTAGHGNWAFPTLRDRIVQQVVKMYMERQIDHRFHKSSYGYRPMKSSKQALNSAVIPECPKASLSKDTSPRSLLK